MFRTLVFLLLLPLSTQAFEIDLPVGLEKVAQNESALDSIALPLGVWDGSEVPSRQLTGKVIHTVFQTSVTTKPDLVAAVLLQQLIKQGYTLALQCTDQACGGYDFKFSLPVIAPPAMYVDLGNFIFLSAYKGNDHAVWLLVSRSLQQTHMQITQLSPTANAAVRFFILPDPTNIDKLGAQLTEVGHFILPDLTFEAGSATLDGDTFPSLQTLAEFLSKKPDQSIVLVGHTDSSGSHDKNLELSKERAQAVQSMLLAQFPNIQSERVTSEGLGYFAPVASNSSPEGREMNRRVEVVLIPTD